MKGHIKGEKFGKKIYEKNINVWKIVLEDDNFELPLKMFYTNMTWLWFIIIFPFWGVWIVKIFSMQWKKNI